MRRPPAWWMLALCLAANLLTSGCLRDDVLPEPFAWHVGEEVAGQGETNRPVDVPLDAQRLRFVYEADVGRESPIPLHGNAGTQLRIRDEEGRVHAYNLTRDGATMDTFGGGVGGRWTFSISDPQGNSAYTLRVDWFAPKHDDWAWWKVWKR